MTGQSLWVSRICFSCPTSDFSDVTSFWRPRKNTFRIIEVSSGNTRLRSGRLPPVAAGLCASAPQPSSPATTPTVSSFAGSGWLQPGSFPETSAVAHPGPVRRSVCGGCLLHHCCSSLLLALHAGSAVRVASVVQVGITAKKTKNEFSRKHLLNSGTLFFWLHLRCGGQWRGGR